MTSKAVVRFLLSDVAGLRTTRMAASSSSTFLQVDPVADRVTRCMCLNIFTPSIQALRNTRSDPAGSQAATGHSSSRLGVRKVYRLFAFVSSGTRFVWLRSLSGNWSICDVAPGFGDQG